MRVGMSTASLFNRYPLEEIPEKLSAYGVTLCEVFLNTFSEYEEEYIARLCGCLVQANVGVYSVHPMGTQFEPQLFSMHPRQRADAWKLFEKVLQAGRNMGAACYVMHGPASLGGAAKHVALSRIGPIAQELCVMSASYGLKIAWENVSWGLYARPSFGPELLNATKADDLRFTLDIKQAARSGYSPFEYLKEMRGRVINVHLCDFTLHPDRIQPMLPGKGSFNFAELSASLRENGYAGPVFYEVYSDLYGEEDELLKSYRRMESIFK